MNFKATRNLTAGDCFTFTGEDYTFIRYTGARMNRYGSPYAQASVYDTLGECKVWINQAGSVRLV